MAKDHRNFHYCYYTLTLIFAFSLIPFLYWFQCPNCCYSSQIDHQIRVHQETQQKQINLLEFPSAWNNLDFATNKKPQKLLKIALFVKKWPEKHHAGGMERHAMTLYFALAKRGHEIHIFTASASNSSLSMEPIKNIHFHFSKQRFPGYLDQDVVWKLFQEQNSTGRPFDVVHTESVGLSHNKAKNLNNLAVSWHGIAYECIHSDIIQELVRSPEEPQAQVLKGRMIKVIEEVRFFPSYSHHVATSDYVGDVLKRIYMIPEERVHIILNGVDEELFKPDFSKGKFFRSRFKVPNSNLVLGMSGRLVKDKGHPLMFEALKQIFTENSTFKESITLLIAGDGPWGVRYKELGPNMLVLGPLERSELAKFYNAIDIFVHPTLRAQGLDQVPLEAALTGKPVMATKVASITESVIVGKEIGYTFSPIVNSLKRALYQVWEDHGRGILELKGISARERSLKLFTGTKMAAAYERLFLCLASKGKDRDEFCMYGGIQHH